MAQEGGASATRVLFVCPRYNANSFWGLEAACELQGAKALAPPLGLITLAALLPQAWDMRLVNNNTGQVTDADILAADLVMVGCMLAQEPDALAVIARCQALGVTVAAGGPAPTSTPEVYEHADFLFTGEAEGVIDRLVAAWDQGERHGRFDAEKFKADVSKSPTPRFDLLKFDDYLWVNVQFSRGCPFTCEFCDIIELYGRAPRTKTPEQVLRELDRLYELGYRGQVDFVDDNLIGNKKAVKGLLPHLYAWQMQHGYPFKFSTEASLNLADDRELLAMMRRANFFSLFVGIETPDEATLVQTSKKQNARRSIADSVERLHRAGMYVAGGFIIGFDQEGEGVADGMIACIQETGVAMATIGLLTALPNTQLSRRLAKEGRLYEGYRDSVTASGDMALAGLNFRTVRPRADVWRDYRRTVAEVYSPEAFFARLRVIGRRVKQPRFQKGARISWRLAAKDARSFGRMAWAMSVTHPELRRLFWGALWDSARHYPLALEAVIRNAGAYLHLYPLSQHLIRSMDARLAEIESGDWSEPPLVTKPLAPAPRELALAG